MIKVPETGLVPKKSVGPKSLNAPTISKVTEHRGLRMPRDTATAYCFECKMLMNAVDHYKLVADSTSLSLSLSVSLADLLSYSSPPPHSYTPPPPFLYPPTLHIFLPHHIYTYKCGGYIRVTLSVRPSVVLYVCPIMSAQYLLNHSTFFYFLYQTWCGVVLSQGCMSVSYTHLTLPTRRTV